jgi:sulfur-oxidizing protein SoxX
MKSITASILAGSVVLLVPCISLGGEASSWGPGANDAAFQAMLKSSFRERGIAKLSRLDQDPTQAFCSDPERVVSKAGAKLGEEIAAANMATVKWPSDGVWLGSFKDGEAVAQSGRGLTSTDKADTPNGGNCYNCHQLSKAEISFGTIGPSLYNYGKQRGSSEDVLRYTWAKIYNAKASNPCSNMPRAGHMGIISEKQIKDLMALLLDPASPVNQ